MKPLIAVFLLSVLCSTNVMASAQGAIIKKKAKDFSNQNSINQGVTPAQPARPATPPAQTPQTAAPATPKINEAQQQNINQLVADLKSIKLKSSATAEQKQKLKTDLLAAAEGAKKPSEGSVNKLANDLSAAWAAQKLNPQEQTFLAKDLNAVMNSANISAADSQAALNSAQMILKYSGISKDDALKINNDLKAIATELQKK
ncbi:MAG: hypothetical protein HY298_17095 [Verrucomicrobia bacterium]|nr:hypothetical protein [Verrucomicrobiota bacterium]